MATTDSLFPSNTALTNIVVTCAQITFTLYSITLASYTFFLSRMDNLIAKDTTLEFVVKNVKDFYQYLIWNITTNVGLVLVISVVLLYLPPAESTPSFFYRLFFNEFILFLIHSVSLIFYYSISITAPNCLKKQAAELKNKLADSNGCNGDAYSFLFLYEQIVCHCNSLIPETLLVSMQNTKGHGFSYTLELLKTSSLVSDDLWEDLLHLINITAVWSTVPRLALSRKCAIWRRAPWIGYCKSQMVQKCKKNLFFPF